MAREKNDKVWIGGGAVAALALAGALWTFAVSPQMDTVNSLKSQTTDARVQNAALQSNVAKLQSDYARIGVTKRELAAAQAQLPSESGLATLTTQLSALARMHHVTIAQISAATPALVTPPTPTAAAAPSSTAPAAPAAGASNVPAPGSLYAIPVSLVVSGTQADELAFAKDMQKDGARSALVSNVSLQNGSSVSGGGSGTTKGSQLTLQLDVFVAPEAPTTTPAPTSAATVSKP